MSFNAIQDQPVAVRLLRNVIARNRVPHGLLFYGPTGVGKGTTALTLAKALNCAEGNGDACGACLNCRKIANGNHADVKIVAPFSKSRVIRVEVVESLVDLAMYRPFEGKWRIVIIEDADRINEQAQNKFLKTLEEPPSNTVFILLTESPRRLLPTIRSRCQSVRFGALRPQTVAELLLALRDVPKEVAPAIAAISQGQMSRALNIVDTGKRDIVLDLTHRLALGEDPLRLSAEFTGHIKAQTEAIRASMKEEPDDEGVVDLSRDEREELKQEQLALAETAIRRELMEFLYLFEAWYRDRLVLHTTSDVAQVMNSDQADRLRQENKGDNGKKIESTERAWMYIERNLNMDRVFRDLFFTYAA